MNKDLTLTMRTLFLQLLAIITIFFTGLAQANTISVDNSYVREVIPGNTITSAYMVINNNRDKDVKLVGAKADVSPRVEIHTHSMEDGMMKMRQLASININANKSVILQPMGFHLMMFELSKPLNAGDTVNITLYFDDASEVNITAPVQSIKQKKHHHH